MILNTKKLRGLSLGEYFLLYAKVYGIDLEESKRRLERRGWTEEEQLSKLATSVTFDEYGRWMKLAEAIRDRFPKGMKLGEYTWRCSKYVGAERLQDLFEKTGVDYTDEQILNATDAYLEKFKNDNTHMRTMRYFIYKNNYDGFTSDLLDMLEELEEPTINSKNIYEKS